MIQNLDQARSQWYAHTHDHDNDHDHCGDDGQLKQIVKEKITLFSLDFIGGIESNLFLNQCENNFRESINGEEELDEERERRSFGSFHSTLLIHQAIGSEQKLAEF